MIIRIIAIVCILSALNSISNVYAQSELANAINNFHPAPTTNLLHMKQWAGKYPHDKEHKTGKSFFELPEIRKSLSKLLSKTDLALLTNTYTVEHKIITFDNYLIVDKCKPHNCPRENALFVINLDDGSMNVAFFRMYNDKSEIRWINSNTDQYHLPEEIQAMLYYGHNPYYGFIPKHKMHLKEYINESKYCLDKSQYSQAIEIINKGIEYYPNSARLFALKGYILNKMGKSDEARAVLQELLNLNPDY